MDFLGKLFERILTSVVISACIFVASFSYMTGKFPPKKADLMKSFSLMKQMVGSQSEFGQKSKELAITGGAVSLEQLADFQKLSLRRTEMGIELMKIFEKIKLSGMDPELEVKLNRINQNLALVEKDLNEVTESLQQASQ